MKQYAASPVINQLIDYRKGYFDTDWSNSFYDVIWNIDTAQGFGLDIWGRIVVIGRNIEVTEPDYFGFSTTPTRSWLPFNQGVFYNGEKSTSVFQLADNAYRALILAKALSNISATDVRSLNRALRSLFTNRGKAYVKQVGPMAIEYVFEFFLEPWESSVVRFSEALPRPAGVSVSVSDENDSFDLFELAANSLYAYSSITLPSDLNIN